MSEYNLLLGHPSVCSDLESDAHLLELLRRQPTNVLRYTTAVDILAPVFDMTFFQDSVLQTLKEATYGQLQTQIPPPVLHQNMQELCEGHDLCSCHCETLVKLDDLKAGGGLSKMQLTLLTVISGAHAVHAMHLAISLCGHYQPLLASPAVLTYVGIAASYSA